MLISARALTRGYSSGRTELLALDSVSFDVADGEFLAIMGPSGSGKSTLMNLIGLLDTATAGELFLAGVDTRTLNADRRAELRNRRIGFVFQSYNLLSRHTALENVALPLVYAGVPRRERRERGAAALERFGLGGRLEHMPAGLSGGEQQRVAIARAMVTEPDLLLADEPTGALDSRTGQTVLDLFQTVNASGTAIVMVTHNESVAHHATRLLRLRDGRVVADEPVAGRPGGAPPGGGFGESAR